MAEILVLSKGEDSPSTRYRALQFFDRLTGAGHRPCCQVLSGGAGNVLRALRAARRADLVLVQRKTLPKPLLWMLRRLARRLIFDFDDAIFCRPNGGSSATRMRRFAAMVRCCDHVTAGNGYLAQAAARFNPDVTVIPTGVDVDRYRVDVTPPSDYFDVVWIGSSSTRKYIEAALPALRQAARRIPSLRLKIVADFDLTDSGLPTLAVPWRSDSEALDLVSAQVGIAPMWDDDWSRGKCALKVLQYMAAGLPVVSSPAGVNAEVVIPGVTGFLAGDDAAWADALHQLAGSAELRQKMGEAGRQRVAALYSKDFAFGKLMAVLEAVADGRKQGHRR